MLQNTIDSLEYTHKSCKNLIGKKGMLEESRDSLKKELESKKEYLAFIRGAKEKYTTVVNELYEESVASLKNTMETAIKYIMTDKDYGVSITIEDKRGTKSLIVDLVDEVSGQLVDMEDIGWGVRTIFSFILKSYYLLNRGSRVLLLDEQYSKLSSHYLPRFYEFVKKFCEENDFIIVMISHIESQIEYADKIYYVNDGVVTEDVPVNIVEQEQEDVAVHE